MSDTKSTDDSAGTNGTDEKADKDEERTVARKVDELILDRIDSLKVLRADTAEERDALLVKIAGDGEPEQDIVSEISKMRPLWRPDRFQEAHRIAMRSIEVLDRNGARKPQLPRLGPLKPIASFIVKLMTRWIVKDHQNKVITSVRRLYERREASAEWGTPDHRMLRQARIDVARVEAGYKGNPLGLPTFLLGGAALSSIVSALQRLLDWAFKPGVEIIVFAVSAGLVFVGLAWAALYSAGVARQRISLSTEQPMKALWETIGAAGNPPRDGSYNFAVYAIVFLALAWILVPVALWVLFFNVRG
ncbi:MAG: hypothetical protein KGR47_14770 [Acidobacteria bacterium]|nr:hypothetical protein [Acidobacteriota bacterium]